MLYAIDTEFMEDGKTIELISIGIVRKDGVSAYAQNRNANLREGNPWVQEHVIPQLEHRACHPPGNARQIGRGKAHCRKRDCPWLWRDQLGDWLEGFLGYDTSPRFLGYYSAYDWVAVCQLFGTMMDLPAGWPMYCIDLRQWLDSCGRQDITQPDDMPHHALSDARWIMQTWLAGHGQYVKGVHP